MNENNNNNDDDDNDGDYVEKNIEMLMRTSSTFSYLRQEIWMN
jgi:hypothetical protein